MTGDNGGASAPIVTFREVSGESRVQEIPLAHLSIELGHLYREDLIAGPDHLRRRFQAVAPWAEVARRAGFDPDEEGRVSAWRVSTCILVDDYSATLDPPSHVLPELVRAAEAAGLRIDYLVRESACAEADGVPVARLVQERIVPDPPPGTDGSRPPVTETGWLCNGQRSPATTAAAMEPVPRWQPPAQNGSASHSIFVDIELWDERTGARTWSCAYLASVWQLLRLGLLRDDGRPVATPQPWPDELPRAWELLPAVVQVNPRAAPFCAYRTFSVLPVSFLGTEHAVRTILSQVLVDPKVLAKVDKRAEREQLTLPAAPVDRIGYAFI